MELNERIAAFCRVGDRIRKELDGFRNTSESQTGTLWSLIHKAGYQNGWFTPESIAESLTAIQGWLVQARLEQWTSVYLMLQSTRRVGIIMAGNIPAVGFHDFLSVLISGHNVDIKCASDDEVLIPALVSWLIEAEPRFESSIRIISRLESPDAVIATGSNNSARYFDYYFGKYPHIIRKNRNSIAVLNGDESDEELNLLGYDIFSYFGLGCRNVSKLYIPDGYKFDRLFQQMESYAYLMNHNKYMNNYDYHRSLFLLNVEPFLTNNFLIIREHTALSTPVSVVHYEKYSDKDQLNIRIADEREQIQCIVGHEFIPFGKSQQPGLTDYADGVDLMKFLTGI